MHFPYEHACACLQGRELLQFVASPGSTHDNRSPMSHGSQRSRGVTTYGIHGPHRPSKASLMSVHSSKSDGTPPVFALLQSLVPIVFTCTCRILSSTDSDDGAGTRGGSVRTSTRKPGVSFATTDAVYDIG